MNSTPPIARFSISLVLGAVWPMYWPTRSSRVTDDQMPFADEAQPMQDASHAQRDGRLAGARIAGERHVQRRCAGGKAQLFARARDQQESRDLADAGA